MTVASELEERYLAAWNARDAALVGAMFVPDGTYEDPTTGGPVEGGGIAEAATRLFLAFPDISFEVQETFRGEGSVAIHGAMRGTNRGSFAGAPPTGQPIALGAVHVLHTEGRLVRSAVAYFDQRTIALQLGLQAPVMPRRAGPMRFGTATRLETGSRVCPGAISFTRIDMGSPAELLRLRDYARPVLAGMAGMRSVIGSATFSDGERLGFTVSAWSSPEEAAEIMAQAEHRAAVRAFFSDGLGVSAWTSVWIPARFNTLWIRCPACTTMVDANAGDVCACGARLPEPPPFF